MQLANVGFVRLGNVTDGRKRWKKIGANAFLADTVSASLVSRHSDATTGPMQGNSGQTLPHLTTRRSAPHNARRATFATSGPWVA